MKLFQKKIWICFMGFSVLSIYNCNHAYADDLKDVKQSINYSFTSLK